ncbi:hypothetical protein E6W36_08670 [Hankyongella ginsenosidimutans]|uniref:Solute-binding protein family 5 domain-containing protein n=1 Tax=Hankyongella ginsenosidimutans TaxID=1763828 RepID=A0A4D7C9I7_9SPHN|nr:hypothetical protein E6W36_08670 [Hankyongella ginsenosidimutans]
MSHSSILPRIGLWCQRLVTMALASTLAALGGCNGGTDPADAPALRIAILGEVRSDDPLQAQSPAERLIAGELHLGLLRIGSGGQLTPGVAESWRVSDDGLSYLFRLKPAKWPDGKDVTGIDAAASLRRSIRDRPDLPALGELDAIEGAVPVRERRKPLSALGVHVLTPDVIEIRLSRPAPALLALLAEPNLAITRPMRVKGRENGRLALGSYRLTAEKTPKSDHPKQIHYDLANHGQPRPDQPWNLRILPFQSTEGHPGFSQQYRRRRARRRAGGRRRCARDRRRAELPRDPCSRRGRPDGQPAAAVARRRPGAARAGDGDRQARTCRPLVQHARDAAACVPGAADGHRLRQPDRAGLGRLEPGPASDGSAPAADRGRLWRGGDRRHVTG